MKNKIALLPLDNRPVSCLLPKQIAEFSGIDLVLPERQYLGNVKQSANLDYIDDWIKALNKDKLLILALDTFMYGGLVQSRKHSIDSDKLKEN
ncbi:MAG: DUF4127 family protein, partial [Candidatus Melainabacteria bacterium]|nr:DUF4127 family protein [Candidatus Melainabacteria bacterium]